MDAAGLRAMQAPIKDKYKSDPKAGMITLKAKGTLCLLYTSPSPRDS